MRRVVLVTGASGFIGRAAVPLLIDAGYEVHAVVRGETPARLNGCSSVVRADLHEASERNRALERVNATHLLHLAWDVTPGEYWQSAENLRWTETSLALARGFASRGGERIVFAGTCAEYDWSHGVCSEASTPLRPHTLYGTCKVALGAILQRLAREGGPSCSWPRVFQVYGPHEPSSRFVPYCIQAVMGGEKVEVRHPASIRDFIYVDDVAACLLALLDSEVEGAVNAASGIPTRLAEVPEIVAEICGAPKPELVAGTGNDPDPVVVGDTRRGEETGWRPRYDLRRGLEETVVWWKNSRMESWDAD